MLPRHREKRSVSFRIFSAFLTFSAVLGSLGILIAAAGFIFGVRPVVVISGSMEPGLPVGSMVFTRQADASTVKVGEIVTVPRNDGSTGKITHRVIDASTSDGVTTLRLKGDANDIEDPVPYQVEQVGEFLFHVPGLGTFALALRTPLGILALGLYVAGVVLGTIMIRPNKTITAGRHETGKDPASEEPLAFSTPEPERSTST